MSSSNTPRNGSGAPQSMRTLFGIIMIIVYIGVGVLFFIGFFDPLFGEWPWVKWVCGSILVVYGIWRGYRQFAGLDPEYGPGYRRDKEDDDQQK
ncbi:MAG: hypothetical protein NC336_04955 [Clostridium sp.]|nr:hypothetical protein [Clostridium sp.]